MTEPWSADEKMIMVLLAGAIGEELAQRGSAPRWRRFRETRERLAYHEIGHAAVAILVGWPPARVEIGPRGGRTYFDEQAAAAGFAGPTRPDDAEIEKLAAAAGWSAERLHELERRTEQLLRLMWPRVTALAEALERAGRLERSEVKTIFFSGGINVAAVDSTAT